MRVFPNELNAALFDMVERHGVYAPDYDPERPPLAALDWDDTCMSGDISHEVLDRLEAEDPRGRVARYHADCARDLYAAYRDLVHTLVAGRTPDEVARMAEEALADGVASGRLQLRTPMDALVTHLHAQGWIVRVVTASPAPLVQPLARRFGIPPDHVLGVRSALEQGRYLPRLLEPVTIGPGKLDAIRAHAGRDPLFAAGDSRSDAPMMLAARYALLFDRGEPTLRQLAAERGWWVVQGTEAT